MNPKEIGSDGCSTLNPRQQSLFQGANCLLLAASQIMDVSGRSAAILESQWTRERDH